MNVGYIKSKITGCMNNFMLEINKNNVFFNEQQFQFDLAMMLRDIFLQDKKTYDLLFEVKTKDCKKNSAYIDLLIYDQETYDYYAIELKYKKDKGTYGSIILPADGAQDLGRYDYLYDISRIEKIYKGGTSGLSIEPINKQFNQCVGGCAIILTNAKNYWEVTTSTVYLYNNLVLTDRTNLYKTTDYFWNPILSSNIEKSVGKNRLSIITFDYDHCIKWSDPTINAKPFRYSIVEHDR